MKKKTIDVERVAAALAELDALVLKHPELKSPEHQERLRVWILSDLTGARPLSDPAALH